MKEVIEILPVEIIAQKISKDIRYNVTFIEAVIKSASVAYPFIVQNLSMYMSLQNCRFTTCYQWVLCQTDNDKPEVWHPVFRV